MKEYTCVNLHCEDGVPVPAGKAQVRPRAECFANCEADCPKVRAKFRITQWCWRIKIKNGGNNNDGT